MFEVDSYSYKNADLIGEGSTDLQNTALYNVTQIKNLKVLFDPTKFELNLK